MYKLTEKGERLAIATTEALGGGTVRATSNVGTLLTSMIPSHGDVWISFSDLITRSGLSHDDVQAALSTAKREQWVRSDQKE